MGEFITVDSAASVNWKSDWRPQLPVSIPPMIDTNESTPPSTDHLIFQGIVKGKDWGDDPYSGKEEAEQIFMSNFLSPTEQLLLGGSNWLDQLRMQGEDDLIGKYAVFAGKDLTMPRWIMDGLLAGQQMEELVQEVKRQRENAGGRVIRAIPQLAPLDLYRLSKEGYSSFLDLNPVGNDGVIDQALHVGLVKKDPQTQAWRDVHDRDRLLALHLTPNPESLRFAIDYSTIDTQGVVTLRPIDTKAKPVRELAA